MAILINEQKLVDDNVFQYENRLNSSISRFLDKSPTFVTYYHVNYQETTMDGGFRDIEEIEAQDIKAAYFYLTWIIWVIFYLQFYI